MVLKYSQKLILQLLKENNTRSYYKCQKLINQMPFFQYSFVINIQIWAKQAIKIIFLMNDKGEHKSPLLQVPKEKQDNKQSLKSKSNISQSEQSNKAIDILRLLSKKQRSRQSRINYQSYEYQAQRPPENRHSDYPTNIRISSFSIDDEGEKYSTYVNKAPNLIGDDNMLDESFLSSYERSGIIGLLLYLLFILFISLEVITTSYVIPKSNSKNQFYFQTALLTILISELAYYLLLRYLSNHTNKRFFLHRSARASFDKLMKIPKNHKNQIQEKRFDNWLFERPWVLLFTVAGTVVICQLLYSKLATQIIFFFETEDEKYMVSTLFWSNFALPYLFGNFYLNRPIQQRNSKVKLFSFIVIAYILQSFIEGLLFFSLMLFNLFYTYIHSRKQFDIVHINQLIKLCMLLVVSVEIIIKQYIVTDGNLFNTQVLAFFLKLAFHVVLLTISMLITRIIAIIYIKEQLYRHYYTETSINNAFIVVAFLLNLAYIGSYNHEQNHIFTAVIINLVFLASLGGIIYIEGKQKLLVVMDSNSQQQ